MNVDLPAFGWPSRPTSASTRSSSWSSFSSPSVPLVNWRGARLVLDLKCRLPRPPSPPLARSARSPWRLRSAISSPDSRSRMIVPTGMRSTMSSAPLPYWSRLRPFSPCWARYWRANRKSISVLMLRSATAQMLPPRPPSPPLGPPRGMNFSRRNAATPLPPLPAYNWMRASSMNFIWGPETKKPYLWDRAFSVSVEGTAMRPPR